MTDWRGWLGWFAVAGVLLGITRLIDDGGKLGSVSAAPAPAPARPAAPMFCRPPRLFADDCLFPAVENDHLAHMFECRLGMRADGCGPVPLDGLIAPQPSSQIP